ncbi:MAG: class I mannose-6-phosphate isomerase [Puniceicoccaceae bacterium]
MSHRGRIITLPQNRVWRTYPGGKVLDQLAGKADPTDSHFPEDWIGSVTKATNPGREEIDEGVSIAALGSKEYPFDKLLEEDPVYFLGEAHVEAFGPRPQLLVKLLDSAVRLHFQCHPTAEFARTRMEEPSGKAEAYHILAVREGIGQPYVYIGFQHPPSRESLKEWIEKQDIAAMEGCFEKIPVKPGDTLYIPGGFPHAIGEGILMVEIMEPSDLAVRFEFEKAGYVLPESARFMGRGLEFCLDVFDFNQTSLEQIREKYFFEPQLIREYPHGAGKQFHLLGKETTACMEIRKSTLSGPIQVEPGRFFIGIVTKGRIRLQTGEEAKELETFEKFLFPAQMEGLEIIPEGEAEILECYPPTAD